MERLDIDLSTLAMEEIIRHKNNLSIRLRQRNFLGQKAQDFIKSKIEQLDLELERRKSTS